MNELLASIYGTHGMEKVASPSGEGSMDLSDLAMAIVSEGMEEGEDFEKVAHVHSQVHSRLIDLDRSGRAMAQAEFSELEKMAFEGNTEPLETFFSDAEEGPVSEASEIRQAVMAEIARRAGR